MPTMLQVRNVPDTIHRRLKARAALAGMSLSDYVLAELRRSVERPTRAELLERLARRTPVAPRPRPAAAVRAARDRRGALTTPQRLPRPRLGPRAAVTVRRGMRPRGGNCARTASSTSV